MKLLVTLLISFLAGIAAFAPQQQQAKSSTSLQAEVSRAGFLSAAAMAIMAPAAASAMDQVLVKDPTEVWETGTPNADAEKARVCCQQELCHCLFDLTKRWADCLVLSCFFVDRWPDTPTLVLN